MVLRWVRVCYGRGMSTHEKRLDNDDAKLVESMVGQTITAAVWGDYCVGWGSNEFARLTLGDGRTVEFHGWGHDAWGATVEDVTDRA